MQNSSLANKGISKHKKIGIDLSDSKTVAKQIATPKRAEKLNFELTNALTVNKRYQS
jgi:hypothetical protein